MAPKKFKVLIAGGSVTGLTLANMLEAVGVDYVVLESHSEIAPQVGASIAVMPNALRILDQLGMYEEIRDLWDGLNEISGMRRSSDGAALHSVYGTMEHTVRRHGYPLYFIDRQMLLQILFQNVKRKSQIHLQKRVTEVIPSENSVTVKTQDGDSFTGDILVGADGIHSLVRKEMWRIASEAKSNCFPPNPQSELTADYNCIFGISEFEHAVKTFFFSTGQDFSYLVASGPGNRMYWFLFSKLDSTKTGDDIPRYTKEDEARIVKEHANDGINESMTFAELYAKRTTSTLVPLEEHIFKRWHFQRIITMGDSAHKVHPISGQGGNSAIETTAVFVNNLVAKIKQSQNNLSDADIEDVFTKVQRIRLPRTQFMLKRATALQRITAQQSRIGKVLFPLLLPLASRHTQLERFSYSYYGASKLDMLDVPRRPRAIPFNDELPAKPIKRIKFPTYVAAGLLVALAYLAPKALRMTPAHILNTFAGTSVLKTKYTGLPSIDGLLSVLVSAFSYPLAGTDSAATVQITYFLPTLAPVLMIWTIESYRIGHRLSFISLPSVFTMAMQLLTIGRTGPIFFLLGIYSTQNGISSRRVPIEVAKSILPAITLGFLIPSALMLLPLGDSFLRQNAIAYWQFVPAYCAALTTFLSRFGFQKVHYASTVKPEKKGKERKLSAFEHTMPKRNQDYEDSFSEYAKDDVPHLKSAYAVAFVVCTLMHVGILAYLALGLNPALTLSSVFLNLPSIFSDWDLLDPLLSWSILFKYDMWFYFASLFVYLMYTVWDLRRLGYVTNVQAAKALLAIVVGQVLVGPGAVYAGVWWWKEDVVASFGH